MSLPLGSDLRPTGPAMALTDGVVTSVRRPRATRDGSRVMFDAIGASGGRRGIYEADTLHGTVHRVTVDPAGSSSDWAPSPNGDGTSFVFATTRSGSLPGIATASLPNGLGCAWAGWEGATLPTSAPCGTRWPLPRPTASISRPTAFPVCESSSPPAWDAGSALLAGRRTDRLRRQSGPPHYRTGRDRFDHRSWRGRTPHVASAGHLIVSRLMGGTNSLVLVPLVSLDPAVILTGSDVDAPSPTSCRARGVSTTSAPPGPPSPSRAGTHHSPLPGSRIAALPRHPCSRPPGSLPRPPAAR